MSLRFALVGPPNGGKSTLFNGLTGGRAKVANHSGVTVETRIGGLDLPDGRRVQLVDLPGIYGLSPTSTDERVAIDILTGDSGAVPDALIVVIDSCNLRTHLQTVLQLRSLNLPIILALNMIDLATRDGIRIDRQRLQELLEVPVIEVRATRRAGRVELIDEVLRLVEGDSLASSSPCELLEIGELQVRARSIADQALLSDSPLHRTTRILDSFLLHPQAGPCLFLLILFTIFQAVFSWAEAPMQFIDASIEALSAQVSGVLPSGQFQLLVTEGILPGIGSVLIFLPQILILFSFILLMEGSGYLARAAFLADELMRRCGLSGQAVIPLLSAFACAIPGIMAARSISSERDRLITIMIAPLMTCSARLPVYTLMVSAFIPPDKFGIFGLQGLVMFGLYLAGVVSGLLVALIYNRLAAPDMHPRLLLLDMPTYKWPQWRDFLTGLRLRATAFLYRAGSLILATSIVLWFLVSRPSGASLRDSYAGKAGALIEPFLRPVGFNLEIAIALIPGMAAREVAVGALGTVYATGASVEGGLSLAETLQTAWPLSTALAFITWYVFAPQCLATFAAIRREVGCWKRTGFIFVYLLCLAWLMAGFVYHTARLAGL